MSDTGNADLVILGGNVDTVDPTNPKAQAVALKFGRIPAVGQHDEIRQLVGSNTRIVNINTKTVDSHENTLVRTKV